MDKTDSVAVTVVVVIICSILIGIKIGAIYGFKDGMIEVSSGQSSCQLITNPDKTTRWECSKNDEEERT